jgi:hypothetical protein
MRSKEDEVGDTFLDLRRWRLGAGRQPIAGLDEPVLDEVPDGPV